MRQDDTHLRKRGGIWYATVYDSNGVRHERSTGCTSKKAARAVLADWERQAVAPDNGTTTLNEALTILIDNRRARVANDQGAERTVGFYEGTAGHLLRHFGHDFRIARLRDSSDVWDYIDDERAAGAKDALIRQDLITLRAALRLAIERGLWRGDPLIVMPDELKSARYMSRTRSPRRTEVMALLPHLPSDTAAAVAFILATSAETAALPHALRADIPDDLDVADVRVPVRGTKNKWRDRRVPIVTDEQRLLLEYAAEHASGTDGRLFGRLANFKRDLRLAAEVAKVETLSPHDLRRAAGQWLIDLGMRLELVSRLMGHRNTRITEDVYARVKEEDLADRMLNTVDSRYATRATAARGKVEPVSTLTALPSPKTSAVLYDVNGTRRTLTEWAKATGISKTTLHYRVVTRGMPMGDAIGLQHGERGQALPGAIAVAARGERVTGSNLDDCRTGAADTWQTAALMAPDEAPLPSRSRTKTPRKMVGAAGFEPTTLRPPV